MVGAARSSGTRAAPARYAVRRRGRVLVLTAAELVALARALALELALGRELRKLVEPLAATSKADGQRAGGLARHGQLGGESPRSTIRTREKVAERLGFAPGTILDWWEADKLPAFRRASAAQNAVEAERE